MFHPIKKPECYDQLKELTDLAQLTLAFALHYDESDVADFVANPDAPRQTRLINTLDGDFLAAHGGEGFLDRVKTGFLDHFAHNGDRLKAGEWLWVKPVAIARPVLRLLVIPKEQKSVPDVIQMFDEDMAILESFDTAADLSDKVGFNYSQNPIRDPEVQNLVKEILTNFYERIFRSKSEIAVEIVGGTMPLNRSIFMRYFAGLAVCPACDGSHAPILDDQLQTDADHFFPLSKYPFFAVHPLNLIPYCKYCNQPPFKGSKDVIDAPRVTNMNDIFHPRRPARDKLKVLVVSTSDGTPDLQVHPESPNASHQAQRESIIYLFDLERRWKGELNGNRSMNRLKSSLQGRIREARQRPEQQGAAFAPNDQWLQRSLRSIRAQRIQDRGVIPNAVTDLAYACWIVENEQARAQLLGDLHGFCSDLDEEAPFEAASRLYGAEARQALGLVQ